MRDLGFVVATGRSITRENAGGNVLWSARPSSEGSIFFAAAGPGSDVYTAGSTFLDSGAAGWIARLNGDGKPLWSRHYELADAEVTASPPAGIAAAALNIILADEHRRIA